MSGHDRFDRASAGDGAPEPTPDQLLAMAYADGELRGDERQSFEARLQSEPALAAEVAQHRALEVITRKLAPPEPADHEWRRLEAEPMQRGASTLGWVGFIAGSVGLFALAIWKLLADDSISLVERSLVAALLIGVLFLFLTALRGRLRTYPLDPYRNVER